MDEENSTTDHSSTLDQALLLISSLISLSHSIKVFSAKWQIIRSKCQDLFSNLTAILNWESSAHYNSSLPPLLDSILATLNSCHDLAKQCFNLSYSGKLLMHSDLDIVSAKIVAHTTTIFDIYAAGLLARSDAILVSRPSAAASMEDVRFYVVDLLSRFKIGSTEMKKQAILAFNEVIQQDERYVTVALQLNDFIGFLVNFLDGGIQQEATKCVCLIAGVESSKSALIGAGVIAPLIRVVESGNEESKKLAATCLLLVTENSDNAWSVSSHGGISALLKICGGGGVELVALACAVLKNLVGVEEIKRFVVEEGGISLFVNLAKCKDEIIKIRSVDLLQTMACNDESVKEIIIEEGGVRALVKVFCPKSSLSTKTREMTLRGIVNICCSSQNSLHLLVNYGFMDHILYFLRHGEVSVQELSLKTAFWLSGTSEEGRKVMGEAGFMPVLVKFLDSKSMEVREMAVETISSLIVVPKNRKKFVQNDQNMGLVLRMLEVNNAVNKNLLLSILMSLTSSSATARKKIATSGYLKHIEKLAEAQFSDAKKIVRKMSSNRLGTILNGIWHS